MTHISEQHPVIWVNGKSNDWPNTLTVRQLLNRMSFESSFLAVAINETCVRRADYDAHTIYPGDRVEILSPMSGG